MKKLIYPFAAITIILGSAFTVFKTGEWKITENYSVKFTSGHPDGVFRGLKGDVRFDEKQRWKVARSFDPAMEQGRQSQLELGRFDLCRLHQHTPSERSHRIRDLHGL